LVATFVDAGVVGLLGGAVALTMVALMLGVCQRSWVVDDAESHGISELQSSLPGGVAVFFGRDKLFCHCLVGGSKHECFTERRFNHEPFAVLLPDILVLD
jgi:hypothetical protein